MSEHSDGTGRRTLIYGTLSVAALILLLVWLEGGFRDKVPPGEASVPASSGVPTVTTAARLQDIGEVASWPGTVSARTEAQLSPKIAARIETIQVRAGDRVSRGDLLVTLDDRSLKAKLEQARSALMAAQAEATRYRADAQRTEALFRKEAATRQSFDAALAATKAGDARVREAESGVREIETLFSETALRAPFDGVVQQRHRDPGDTALPGTPILTILESSRLRVEVPIPERCAGSLRIGNPLSLVERATSRRLTVEVSEIAPSADPQTHTVLIKANLPSGSSLKPGTFIWVEQACGQRRVLLIPASAVRRVGQIESVHLVREGRAELRHVRTGQAYGDAVEVLSGLKEGDLIATRNP
ncbi:efflux RND transporter periplasmic adaptor subunit [Methylolobus aquaticus]|nr:efflux RND transporter periplasmic adaptor subunit [Methylolobus aquaticus]